jgi:hypothetical protein
MVAQLDFVAYGVAEAAAAAEDWLLVLVRIHQVWLSEMARFRQSARAWKDEVLRQLDGLA